MVHVQMVQIQPGGSDVMKACGSEMPHGWVKPGPLRVWAQGVICNLKALSALNVNSSFVGVIIIAMIRMSQSHTPKRFAKEDEQIIPVCCRMGNQGTKVIVAHTRLEINLNLLCCCSPGFCMEAVGSKQVFCHHLCSVLSPCWQ